MCSSVSRRAHKYGAIYSGFPPQWIYICYAFPCYVFNGLHHSGAIISGGSFIRCLALLYYAQGTVEIHHNVPWYYTSDSFHPCIPVPRGIQISSLRSLNKCLYHANPPYSGRHRPTHEWCKNFLFRPTSAGPWVMGDSHHRFTHQIWKSPRNIGWQEIPIDY